MNRIGRTLRSIGVFGLLVSTLLTAGGATAAQAPVPAPLFLPITIASLGPVSAQQPTLSWVATGDDWVAFAAAQPGCGHCQASIPMLYLQNLYDTRRITLRSATAVALSGSETTLGASDLHFSVDQLYWRQPTAAPSGYQFRPGAYACSLCYYDPATGQGGAWNAAVPPGLPLPTVTLEAGPPPTYRPVTLVVTWPTAPDKPVRITLDPREQAAAPLATDGRKVVYTSFTETAAPGGGGTRTEQVIRVGWLAPPDAAVAQVWARADAAVQAGRAARPWLWGPAPRYAGREAYGASPRGDNNREVVYYDKARLEINPLADPTDPAAVTGGLLVAEMIGGQIQLGETQTLSASVACAIPVTGDPRPANPLSPSYAALAPVASLHGDHQAPERTGQPVDGVLDVQGVVSVDPAHGSLARYAAFVPQTGHNIPDVFWGYLQGLQGTYGFDWVEVVGYPLTEGYWTQMRVAGKDYPVLIQAYQRRVLTYSPEFAPPWQIQQGNVGQHYLEWRYRLNGLRLLGVGEAGP